MVNVGEHNRLGSMKPTIDTLNHEVTTLDRLQGKCREIPFEATSQSHVANGHHGVGKLGQADDAEGKI